MNWQTKDIFKQAREQINDEAVFSPDQIKYLQRMLYTIESAVAKESDCNKSSVTM